MATAGESAFLIDLESGHVESLQELTLQSAGLRERTDLQRWVLEHPEIVGDNLLLVTSEFDRWELREQRVSDRLDALFLDAAGALVVAELKRDRAPDVTDLQALKYAAFCSQLTIGDVAEEFARFHGCSIDEAAQTIHRHAPPLADGELAGVRIRLVAGEFGPAVTSVVLWLRDFDLDIGCVEVTVRGRGDGKAVLSSRQLLPLPEAEDYLVRRRRREQEEEQARRGGARGANSIFVLAEAGVLTPGIELRLGLDTLTAKWRPAVADFLAAHPTAGVAEWTGDTTSRSLRWRHDGRVYSPTGLTKQLLVLCGIEPRTLPGPDYWVLPDGRPLYRASLEVRGEATELA